MAVPCFPETKCLACDEKEDQTQNSLGLATRRFGHRARGSQRRSILRDTSALQALSPTNRETLNRIRCESVQKLSYTGESRLCDVTTIHNDAELDSSDFVLTKDTYFVLLASADLPRLPLATVDLAFIRQFRQPTRVEMPDGSVWRLYSHPSEIKGHAVEVFVGHLEMAPWTHV